MIKENELRIGNWIYDDLCERNVRIEGITKKVDGSEGWEFYYIEHSGGYTCIYDDEEAFIKGIPVTAEILDKAGFAKDKDGCYLNGNCFYWIEGIFQVAYGYAPIVDMECGFVHQLQNIYYILTGTELTIELILS